MTAAIADQFTSAVNIVHNLPKEGSFQPSNDLKLRFYALYKQATNGKCNIPRPAFWDVINKAKWDAWHSLGDMSSEQAMQEYVNAIKEIVETMPVSENVEDFIAKIGPMYAVVDPSGQSLEANGDIRKVMIANGSIDHNANGHMDYDKMISNMTNGGGQHVVLRDKNGDTKKSKKEQKQNGSVKSNGHSNSVVAHSSTASTNGTTMRTEQEKHKNNELLSDTDADEHFADASDSLEHAEISLDQTTLGGELEKLDDAKPKAIMHRHKHSSGRSHKMAVSTPKKNHQEEDNLKELFDEAWNAVERLRTEGVAATQEMDSDWSPELFRTRKPRTAKNRDGETAAGTSGNTGRTEERGASSGMVIVPRHHDTTNVRHSASAESDTGHSGSSDGDTNDMNWDPHVATVLFRMHRQLQQISNQLSLVETSLITQQRLIAAMVQQYQRTTTSFWARLPWRTVAFIVFWPVIVNIVGRIIWWRIMKRRQR